MRGGKVKIAGTCPNQLEGPESTFEPIGRYDGDSYRVDFATAAVGDNGRMTFSGTMTGRKTGVCPSNQGRAPSLARRPPSTPHR